MNRHRHVKITTPLFLWGEFKAKRITLDFSLITVISNCVTCKITYFPVSKVDINEKKKNIEE